MVEVNKFKLGLFVIGTVVLSVIVLFMMGLSEKFAPKGKLVTFFSESVQGLDVGSAVKYKGVPVGRVSAIYIDTKDKKIRVDMDVELKNFTVSDQEGAMMSVNSFYDFCKNERALGLRCRLDYGGLTGLKYIELDYFAKPNPGEARTIPRGEEFPGRLMIPSTPSTLTDIMGKLNRSLEQIASVDFEGISGQLMKSLGEASSILGDGNLKASIARFNTISANLEKVSVSMADTITEASIGKLISEVENTLNEINTLSGGLAVQIEQARLGETSLSVRNSAIAIEDFRRDFMGTVIKFNTALDVFTSLVEYLNDDPNALIMGKRAPVKE